MLIYIIRHLASCFQRRDGILQYSHQSCVVLPVHQCPSICFCLAPFMYVNSLSQHFVLKSLKLFRAVVYPTFKVLLSYQLHCVCIYMRHLPRSSLITQHSSVLVKNCAITLLPMLLDYCVVRVTKKTCAGTTVQ